MEMSIGALARRSGLTTSAIRYYEQVGLLPAPRRASGRRLFDEPMLNRLLVVTIAKEAGFSLREIHQLFSGFATTTSASARWQKLAAAKLEEIEALEVRLDAMKHLLREALRCGCLELEMCGQLLRQRQDGERISRLPVGLRAKESRKKSR
jgi:MerR family transcriptional regulator, redox-sensitive transcriptional activator SoxR